MSIISKGLLMSALLASFTGGSALVTAAEKQEAPIPRKIPTKTNPKDDVSVRIRTNDNGDVVEEYLQGSRVSMVKVTPKNAKPYYIMDNNGDGVLDRADAEAAGGIVPVSWVIAEW